MAAAERDGSAGFSAGGLVARARAAFFAAKTLADETFAAETGGFRGGGAPVVLANAVKDRGAAMSVILCSESIAYKPFLMIDMSG